MSSKDKNLSLHSEKSIQDIGKKQFAIVVAEWNTEVTEALYEGAYKKLIEYGAKEQNIHRYDVPGSFELTLAAQWAAQKANIDAIICLGCVIQGDEAAITAIKMLGLHTTMMKKSKNGIGF